MGGSEAKVDSDEWKSSGRKHGVDCGRAKSKRSPNKGPKSQNEAKRSHGDQPLYSQWDTLRATRTKPRRLSPVTSIVYGHFGPVLSQVTTDGTTLYIADSGSWDGEAKQSQTKPSRLSYFDSLR